MVEELAQEREQAERIKEFQGQTSYADELDELDWSVKDITARVSTQQTSPI